MSHCYSIKLGVDQFTTGLDLGLYYYLALNDLETFNARLEENAANGDPRERALGENAVAIAELEGADRQGFYFAHNAHVGRGAWLAEDPASGQYLADAFGRDYVAVFTDFYDGSFTAVDQSLGESAVFSSGPITDDSLAAALVALDTPQLWLDLRQFDPDDPEAAWLFEPLNHWQFPGFYSSDPDQQVSLWSIEQAVLPERFDGVLFVANPEHARYDQSLLQAIFTVSEAELSNVFDRELLGPSVSLADCSF